MRVKRSTRYSYNCSLTQCIENVMESCLLLPPQKLRVRFSNFEITKTIANKFNFLNIRTSNMGRECKKTMFKLLLQPKLFQVIPVTILAKLLLGILEFKIYLNKRNINILANEKMEIAKTLVGSG